VELRSEVPVSKPPLCNEKSIAFPLLRTAASYRGGNVTYIHTLEILVADTASERSAPEQNQYFGSESVTDVLPDSLDTKTGPSARLHNEISLLAHAYPDNDYTCHVGSPCLLSVYAIPRTNAWEARGQACEKSTKFSCH